MRPTHKRRRALEPFSFAGKCHRRHGWVDRWPMRLPMRSPSIRWTLRTIYWWLSSRPQWYSLQLYLDLLMVARLKSIVPRLDSHQTFFVDGNFILFCERRNSTPIYRMFFFCCCPKIGREKNVHTRFCFLQIVICLEMGMKHHATKSMFCCIWTRVSVILGSRFIDFLVEEQRISQANCIGLHNTITRLWHKSRRTIATSYDQATLHALDFLDSTTLKPRLR